MTPNEYITAVTEWITSYTTKGFSPSLMTFMFKPIHGSQWDLQFMMQGEIERFYSRLVTRAVRNPNGRFSAHKRPILLGMPDLPVFKRKKQSFRDVSINDGLHYHTITLMPYESRIKQSLADHIELNKKTYIRNGSFIDRIDVIAIDKTQERAIDYTLKSLKRRNTDFNNFILLPKSISELRCQRCSD